MNQIINELEEGQKIMVPKSKIRTVSLQKLRAPSPCIEKQTNIYSNALKPKVSQQTGRLYQKMRDKKLGIKNSKQLAKQKLAASGQHIIGTVKFQQIKKQAQINEMKECTFKPQTNIPSDLKKRNVNEFFNQQLNFNKIKNDKIQQMRLIIQANKDKENTFRPNAFIGKAKQKVNGQDSDKVYERLYQDSKNKDKRSVNQRLDSVETVVANSITKSNRFKGISRGNSVEKITRRQSTQTITNPSVANDGLDHHFQKIKTNQQNASMDLSQITCKKASVELVINQVARSTELTAREGKSKQVQKRIDLNIYQKKDKGKSEEIYIAKLMKQMIIVMEKCGLPLVFSYMQMSLFFQKMNFITKQAIDSSRKHLYEIWSTLQGETYNEVSALSIMKIVYAIMGCYNVNLVNKCINDHWLSNQEAVDQYEISLKFAGKQLSYRQNILMLTEKDSRAIKVTFDELYLNRLKLGESQLTKQERQVQYSFKPTISKTSVELAERYRNRIISESQKLIAENKMNFEVPRGTQINHVDLLMLDQKRKDALLRIKREENQREAKKIQDEIMRNPNSILKNSNKSSRNYLGSQRDRNQQLFQMGKEANINRKDKSSDEIEQQKWKNQLTFKPNINSKTNILQVLNAKDAYIPDYDKAVYRMHEGRKMRECSQVQQNTSPLLYLNVATQGSEAVKVPVFSSDNMKSITQKVRKMMNFNRQEGSIQLQKILKVQILPALKQMGLANFADQ